MRTFKVRPRASRGSALLLTFTGILALTGCQTVASSIADSNTASPTQTPPTTATPAPSPTPTPTTPDPTPTPTPAPIPTPEPIAPPVQLPTTLSRALNDSSVFIGASIMNYWPLPMHNAGIAGQTSAQVLQRFSRDVLNHGYARVIIQVGSNDLIQQVKDPPATISANIASMAREARAAKIDVYIISLGPITSSGRNFDSSASAVNESLRALCTAQGYGYIDIFTPLWGHPEYFLDGLHPTAGGYAVIEKALAQVVLK